MWAALQSLGRDGVADLVERCCVLAARFAELLAAAGADVLNNVVLNQAVVSFGDDHVTDDVIAAVQAVDRSAAAVIELWNEVIRSRG